MKQWIPPQNIKYKTTVFNSGKMLHLWRPVFPYHDFGYIHRSINTYTRMTLKVKAISRRKIVCSLNLLRKNWGFIFEKMDLTLKEV